MHNLPRTFYSQRTLTVAKELLGKIFIRKINGKILSGMIVETEAYLHYDTASHAYRGLTERNKPMFNAGGYLYVYFTYGMHYCANVVTSKEGIGEAVLIRAVEPIEGIEIMMKNRFKGEDKADFRNAHLRQNLTNGPAKFAQAFALTKMENGIDLCNNDIFIIDGEVIPKSKIISTTRIGISTGTEKRWRFYIKRNEWVSKR